MKMMSLGTQRTKWSKQKFTGEPKPRSQPTNLKNNFVSFPNWNVQVFWYLISFWHRSRKVSYDSTSPGRGARQQNDVSCRVFNFANSIFFSQTFCQSWFWELWNKMSSTVRPSKSGSKSCQTWPFLFSKYGYQELVCTRTSGWLYPCVNIHMIIAW